MSDSTGPHTAWSRFRPTRIRLPHSKHNSPRSYQHISFSTDMVFCLPSRKPSTWLEESTAEKHTSAQRDLARQEVDLAGLTNTQRQLKEEALHNLQALMEENKVDV